MSEPEKVVAEYFALVRAGDIAVAELFHIDAILVGLGTTRVGQQAIRESYTEVIERAGPAPRLVGPLLVEGPRVAAEIMIELSGGNTVHAVDLFVVQDGRIRSLTYFLCRHSR